MKKISEETKNFLNNLRAKKININTIEATEYTELINEANRVSIDMTKRKGLPARKFMYSEDLINSVEDFNKFKNYVKQELEEMVKPDVNKEFTTFFKSVKGLDISDILETVDEDDLKNYIESDPILTKIFKGIYPPEIEYEHLMQNNKGIEVLDLNDIIHDIRKISR